MKPPTAAHPSRSRPRHDAGPQPGKRKTEGTVREVPLPADARALSTLSRIDYADAFLLQIGPGQSRTGEQWARVMLEEAPITTRASLLTGWSALGLKLGSPHSALTVLGWEVRRSTPQFALLAAGSHIGMPAELLFKPHLDTLLFATLIRHDNPVARAIWAPVGPGHRRVVRDLLQRAAALARDRP